MGVTSVPDWNTLANKPTVVTSFNGSTGAVTGVSSMNGATGAVTNTNLYDIGSFVMGRPKNATNYATNATVAGSILYAMHSKMANDNAGNWNIGGTPTLVNTGSWRCVSPADYSAGDLQGFAGIWVRYA